MSPSLLATDKSTDLPPQISIRSSRLPWLDASKAYGMFLVYYGHFVERIADMQGFVVGTAAFSQYKFIYAFHMPLFFILSGFLCRDKQLKFSLFLTRGLLVRILPALFFNLVALGIRFLESTVAGDASFAGRYRAGGILWDVLSGYPFANFITWFLVCLFTVELLNYWLQPLLKTNGWKRTGTALVILVIGYYLGLYQHRVAPLPLRGLNTWYLNEALIGFFFYQVGILFRQLRLIELLQRSFYRYVGLGVALMATMALFDLNQGPFSEEHRPLVLMAVVSHGNLFLFGLTAITGALAVICLALWMSGDKRLVFIGQNTLILLGINFFFAGFTKPMVTRIGLSFFDHWWTVLLFCTVLTLISFVVSTPVIWLLRQFLPQLVGQPKVKGPILPTLLRPV